MQAIKDNTSAVRISEQQAIDCNTGVSSCEEGGLIYEAWDYWRDHGAMSNADYPYTGKDDETCKTVSDYSISTTGPPHGWIGALEKHAPRKFNTQQVIDQLQNGPVGAHVYADLRCWKNPDGILTEEMGCPTKQHNHAVTIVAYTAAVEGRGGESTFEKICPPSFEKNCTKTLIFHETCTPEPHCTFQAVMGSCRRAGWKERIAKECKDDLQFMPYGRGIFRNFKQCCSIKDVETCITEELEENCAYSNIPCDEPADDEPCETTEIVGPPTPSTPAYWTI